MKITKGQLRQIIKEELDDMIVTFKKSMNAKSSSGDTGSSGLFIKSPDVFKLTYKTGRRNHKFLHKFSI